MIDIEWTTVLQIVICRVDKEGSMKLSIQEGHNVRGTRNRGDKL